MRKVLVSCLIVMALIVASCSSEENAILPGGKGTVNLNMTVGADFGVANTRAVDLSQYQNKDNYTLQIFKSDNLNIPVESFTYAMMPMMPLTLDNGTYVLKAFYGVEHNSSRDEFLVTGSQTFSVNSNDQSVKAVCRPTCAKVQVNFDTDMAKYFSDYFVVFSPTSGDVVWAKDDTNPWYILVNKAGETVKATIHITRKAEYGSGVASTTVERSLSLAPDKSWTLKVAPSYESGQLGIKIIVDETTNDKDVEVEVPSEWYLD